MFDKCDGLRGYFAVVQDCPDVVAFWGSSKESVPGLVVPPTAEEDVLYSLSPLSTLAFGVCDVRDLTVVEEASQAYLLCSHLD